MLVSPLATSTTLEAFLQLGPLALLGLAYAKRVQTLGRQRRPVPGWRQACFYAGFVTIGAALTSLGGDSQELLSAHMVEHLLLGDIAALLIVLGLTGPLIAPILRVKLFDRLRILAHPLIAFPLWAIDLYVWHLPVFYEAALRALGRARARARHVPRLRHQHVDVPVRAFADARVVRQSRQARLHRRGASHRHRARQRVPVVWHRVLPLLRPRRRDLAHLAAWPTRTWQGRS